jgi:hypothetical protein
MEKRIILSKHAAERLLERKMSIPNIRKFLEKGVRIPDKVSGAILCIYKQGQGRYYTLVVDEGDAQATIITGYSSANWQVEQYHKVKKDERAKVH